MNIEESLNLYLRYLKYEKNLTPNTILSYNNDLLLMKDYLIKNKIYDVKEMTLSIFRNFLKFLDKYQYSNRTIIRKFSSYINYFKFLEQNSLIDVQLSQKISLPKIEKRFYNFLSESEINNLLETIDEQDNFGIRGRAIFELFYSTGARISELVNITLDKIDIKNKEIEVFGKGRKSRIVYLNDISLEKLSQYLNIRSQFLFDKKNNNYKKNNYLFLNKNGGSLSSRFIRILLDKYLKKAEINKKISPHSIRHSFASHMLQEGAGIREVQELLGHENISTTQIYTHLNLKKLKKDYEKFHPRAN
ncbi:MAG: tyrosine recombinase XerC [Actinobacteria bacterium]|nr:tyrosine recombinase XerC [Actinomycetota bacterium]